MEKKVVQKKRKTGLDFNEMNIEELKSLLKAQLDEKNKLIEKIRKYLVDKNEEILDLIDVINEIGNRLFLMEGMNLELKDIRDNSKKLYNELEFLFPEGRD